MIFKTPGMRLQAAIYFGTATSSAEKHSDYFERSSEWGKKNQ